MAARISATLLRTQPDRRLVALAADGSEPAFEALVDRYRQPLEAYCRRLLLPADVAEDVVQEALLSTWQALRRGNDIQDPRAWLYLGLTAGAVRGLVYRARAALRTAAGLLLPGPAVAWASSAGARAGVPMAERIGELVAGGGAAGGIAALVTKGGATVATVTALAGGAAVVSDRPEQREAPASASARPSIDDNSDDDVVERAADDRSGRSGSGSDSSGSGSDDGSSGSGSSGSGSDEDSSGRGSGSDDSSGSGSGGSGSDRSDSSGSGSGTLPEPDDPEDD